MTPQESLLWKDIIALLSATQRLVERLPKRPVNDAEGYKTYEDAQCSLRNIEEALQVKAFQGKREE
jgi:hypothetical protein